MKYNHLFLISLFFITSCASTPNLVRWEKQEMELCCAYCNTEEWNKSVQGHCRGAAELIGGYEKTEDIGWSESQEEEFGSKEKTKKVLKKETSTTHCRKYKCSVYVTP